jgi:hypothetical protein
MVERSVGKAISWLTRDCFGGYRRLAMTGPRSKQGVPFVLKFPEVKMHYRYFRIWIRLL